MVLQQTLASPLATRYYACDWLISRSKSTGKMVSTHVRLSFGARKGHDLFLKYSK